MTLKTKIEHKREKSGTPFVSIYEEKVLTKNVNLSNVKSMMEIGF
jgi:hypothetical protein